MRKYMIKTGLAFLLGSVLCSCYKDLGNYDYHEINEVTIGKKGFDDTTYVLKSFIDTLRIQPEVEASMLQHPENYEYRWIAVGDRFKLGGTWEIGQEKDLIYPLNLPEQDYTLYFRVKDKSTQVVYTRVAVLSLKTVFSTGWLVLGEDDNGKAQLDMLAIVGRDTLLMKDILAEAGLPELGKPTSLFIPIPNMAEDNIQVGTDNGTYKLDPDKLMPIADSHLKYSFFDVSSAGPCVLQDASQLYMFRVEIIDGKLYYDRDRITGKYARIGNPSNHYKGEYKLFKIGDKVGYSLSSSGRMLTAVVCYDDDNKRFVYQGGGMSNGIVGYCDSIADAYASASDLYFSWRTGQDFVTTINSRKAGISNYTILKNPGASSPDGYYLYGYNILNTGLGFSFEKKFKKKQLTKADEIDKAEFFASSVNNSVIFYTVGSCLYGYNYNTDKSKKLLDFAGEDSKDGKKEVITCLWYDQDPINMFPEDEIWLGVYDPTQPASTGGRLVGYTVENNPNDMVVKEIPGSSKAGFCKIVSIGYK